MSSATSHSSAKKLPDKGKGAALGILGGCPHCPLRRETQRVADNQHRTSPEQTQTRGQRNKIRRLEG